MTLTEAGLTPNGIQVANWDVGEPHHLKISVLDESPAVRIRVWVDGQPLIDRQDVTPQTGGAAGLATRQQAASFDNFLVRVP